MKRENLKRANELVSMLKGLEECKGIMRRMRTVHAETELCLYMHGFRAIKLQCIDPSGELEGAVLLFAEMKLDERIKRLNQELESL